MNLKKHLSALLLITVLAVCMLAGCGKDADSASNTGRPKLQEAVSSEKDDSRSAADDTQTDAAKDADDTGTEAVRVTLNEVAHSIFYAPLYAAIENGYFEENGIHLELVTGFGADKVMAALLSGEADIGFMGPETTVYTYNEGAADAVVNFAQLTQRAGNFIVAREKMDDFKLSDLKGADVLGGRAGGMPSHDVTLEHFTHSARVIASSGVKPSPNRGAAKKQEIFSG